MCCKLFIVSCAMLFHAISLRSNESGVFHHDCLAILQQTLISPYCPNSTLFFVCLLCAVFHVSPFCFDPDLFHLHHFKICLPLMFPFMSNCFTISPTNVSAFHTLERISRRKIALTIAGSLRCVWVLSLAFFCDDSLNFLFSTR